VRLDHLLSKEHLPAEVGKEPASPECGGGVLDGGDTGESGIGHGHGPLVQRLLRYVVGGGCGVAGGWR
jgi:hypothetical protein